MCANVEGKKLLILGGTYASLDVVKVAKSLGIYTIVADYLPTGVAKDIADESVIISTNDFDKLIDLIKEKNIDGVFCGPSEFNLKNVITLCDRAGLRCYATPKQWEICSNKETFKNYCRKNGVPTAPEYEIDHFVDEGADSDIEYPIIVKPVDGCSSKGISICNTREEVLKAYDFALSCSNCKRVVIEKYIDNGGSIFSFRYLIKDGEFYPYLMFDTYIVDPVEKKYLISAFTCFPSSLMDQFRRDLDEPVRRMFADMGLKNGTAFIQAIPYNGKIFCHEMGYRLSGGMIYKITEPLMNVNDMKMMVRFAAGGEMATEEEISNINLSREDLVMAQLMIPLCPGTIAKVSGLDEILKKSYVSDFLQYYYEGDVISEKVMGTLMQHFGRFTLKGKTLGEILSSVNDIQDMLLIVDTDGNDMYKLKFDTNRVK